MPGDYFFRECIHHTWTVLEYPSVQSEKILLSFRVWYSDICDVIASANTIFPIPVHHSFDSRTGYN